MYIVCYLLDCTVHYVDCMIDELVLKHTAQDKETTLTRGICAHSCKKKNEIVASYHARRYLEFTQFIIIHPIHALD